MKKPYTRREFLALGGVAAVGVVVAGCGTQDDGTSPATSAPGPNLDPLEIRVTESPVHLLSDREVLASKRVIFEALDTPTSFDLTSAGQDHHYAFTVERTSDHTSIDLDVILAGELWKEMHATYTTDASLNRLWVSRGYLHGEGHTTSCFPAPQDQKPFEGQVWFGSFDEDRRLLDETLGSFDYSSPSGTVEILKGTETPDSASRNQFVLMDEAAQDVASSNTQHAGNQCVGIRQ